VETGQRALRRRRVVVQHGVDEGELGRPEAEPIRQTGGWWSTGRWVDARQSVEEWESESRGPRGTN